MLKDSELMHSPLAAAENRGVYPCRFCNRTTKHGVVRYENKRPVVVCLHCQKEELC